MRPFDPQNNSSSIAFPEDGLEPHPLDLRVRGLRRSATIEIQEISHKLQAEGKSVVKLGLGQSPFPVPRCVVDALSANAHQKAYLEVQGLRRLREAIAGFHSKNDGLNFDPDLMMVGPGSKELMFLLQVAFYGDLVVPTPCWVSYVPQARIVGRPVQLLPTVFEDRWHLSAEALDRLCAQDPGRARIVILNYPSNPDGTTYSLEELKQLAKVARNRRLVLLSDEIYGKLNYTGGHISIARFYPEGTIVSSGLSKWCGAGGWRLGTFAFPRPLHWLMEAMASVASETFTSTSAPIQYAAIRAFEGGEEIELYLAHSRRILSALGRWVAHRLREAGARVHDPEGAFYLFPDFSPLASRLEAHGITTSAELCSRALEATGVAFLPGAAFGRPLEELTARLATVDFDGAAALAASQRIPLTQAIEPSFLEAQCFKVTGGISKLCEWLELMR